MSKDYPEYLKGKRVEVWTLHPSDKSSQKQVIKYDNPLSVTIRGDWLLIQEDESKSKELSTRSTVFPTDIIQRVDVY